jgi:hypothetical protein
MAVMAVMEMYRQFLEQLQLMLAVAAVDHTLVAVAFKVQVEQVVAVLVVHLVLLVLLVL